MSDSFYYLNADRQSVGPFDLPAIRQLVEAGVVGPDVLVCPAGEDEWKPLAQWNEPTTREPVPPLTPPPPRPASAQSTPALEAAPATSYPDWLSLVAMATGIVSFLSCFFPVIAILLAVPALILGALILKQPVGQGKGFALTGVVTGALGLIATLLILAGGWGVGSDVAAIERTLADGIKISRDAARQFPDDSVRQSRFIASELQKVDTRKCPPEFRVAHQHHIDAWEVAIPYFEADNPATWFLEGFFGGMIDDYSAVGLSNYRAQLAARDIDETYRELKTIAAAYGARIPTR